MSSSRASAAIVARSGGAGMQPQRTLSAQNRLFSAVPASSAVAFRATVSILALLCGRAASAQAPPAPVVRVAFADAIRRAQENNPTGAEAAAGIPPARGVVRQARAATLLQVSGSGATTTLNRSVEFDGLMVTPRSAVTASLTADMPILAAAAWARRTQAQDARAVADLSAAETRRQIAFAT